MGKREDRRFFPLTSLQIGDLQSYLSHLTLFLAIRSEKFYILVDNRPWVIHQDSRATHLWQLMVTKSRLSPFANTRSARVTESDIGKILRFTKSSRSVSFRRNRLRNWFSLIDAALNYKKNLHQVKKLKDSFLLSNDLHCPLYGCIVFEVEWRYVRGINYINELQTDTSLALEVKLMKRWEFDSIEQASSCIYLWYTGICDERYLLQDYLESICSKDVFYDAQEDVSSSSEASEKLFTAVESYEEKHFCMHSDSSCSPRRMEDLNSPFTPPASGPYKRRKIIKSSMFVDVDGLCEEACSEVVRSPSNSVSSSSLSGSENDDGCLVFEATTYKDVLLLFRFDDHDLPFKLKEIIMSDLRLLTLLEYGLPSWVIFLQSYPVFCQIYRPWMCPLARVFYVLISIITVLIGFYDLYKNVPILKATAASLFGPFFNWIESWEMVSRIRYLGTMLFLHNFEKALMWFLMVARATKSLFSVLTKPIAGPIMELFELIFPIWNACFSTLESLIWVIWNVLSSSCNVVSSILEIIIWPFWFALSTLWSVGGISASCIFFLCLSCRALSYPQCLTFLLLLSFLITVAYVIYPVVWLLLEIVSAPVRLIVTLASFLGMFFINVYYLLQGTWSSIWALFQIASPSKTTSIAYEVPIWRSLWNVLFSKVFRAIRSIFYGFVAFFTACNRHRLSIYNHILVLLHRFSHVIYPWRLSEADHGKKKEINQSPLQEGDRPIPNSGLQTPEKLLRRRARRRTSTS